jgi:hypothetical protein
LNISDARGVWTVHGYIGEYRLCWRSDYQPVLLTDRKGRKLGPEYFKTKDAAECAAWRTKHELEQPVMVRDGVKIEARSKADAIFDLPKVRARA